MGFDAVLVAVPSSHWYTNVESSRTYSLSPRFCEFRPSARPLRYVSAEECRQLEDGSTGRREALLSLASAGELSFQISGKRHESLNQTFPQVLAEPRTHDSKCVKDKYLFKIYTKRTD